MEVAGPLHHCVSLFITFSKQRGYVKCVEILRKVRSRLLSEVFVAGIVPSHELGGGMEICLKARCGYCSIARLESSGGKVFSRFCHQISIGLLYFPFSSPRFSLRVLFHRTRAEGGNGNLSQGSLRVLFHRTSRELRGKVLSRF